MEFYCDNEVWFVERERNIICHVDNDTRRLFFHAIIPYGKADPFRAHPCCIKTNNTVVCFPDRGNSIVCYDLTDNLFKECLVPKSNNATRLAMVNYWKIGEEIWAVSTGDNSITEFDLDRKEIIDCYRIRNDKSTNCATDACLIDQRMIVFPFASSNEIILFDIIRRKIIYRKIAADEIGFNTVSAYDGKLYLTGYTSNIYTYDLNSEKITRYKLEGLEINGKRVDNHVKFRSPIFRKSIMVGEDIIVLVPWYKPDTTANALVTFNINTCEASYIYFSDLFQGCEVSGSDYLYVRAVNDRVIEILIDKRNKRTIDVKNKDIRLDNTEIDMGLHYELSSGNSSILLQEIYRRDLEGFLRVIGN